MRAMTFKTECAHVGQVAFTPTFNHRHNMVRVPQGFSAAESPAGKGASAGWASQPLNVAEQCVTIQAADLADASIPLKNTIAEMTGIGA